MSSRTLARARFGAAVAIAFACGIVFASGFDLTRFRYAQSRAVAAKPTVQTTSQAQIVTRQLTVSSVKMVNEKCDLVK